LKKKFFFSFYNFASHIHLFFSILEDWRGLRLAWDLGHKSVILKSNFNTTMDLITRSHSIDFHPHATIFFSH